ncbi:MAG: cell division protein FtsW [Anaerolineales bacterium]|nr:cell division protein FtsW [Anaerolineales bacterium]
MFSPMGDAATRRGMNPTKPLPTKPQRKHIYLGLDAPMLLVTITLVIFGMVMVYSASTDYSLLLYGEANRIFMRQLQVFGLSIIAVILLTFFDYRWWLKLALPALGVTILALFAVLVINEERHGAVRTLWEGSIQPSELAKLVMVIYLSVWLYSKREILKDVKFGLIPMAGIMGIVGGLIIVQPDISAFITIFILGGTLFFLAGGDLKQIFILIVIATLVGSLIVLWSDTGSQRINSFLPGLVDPMQAPYHVRRSMEAMVSGGWFGVGIGKALTKYTGLPVPPTDSIFAVVSEETGVIGAMILIALYMVFLWRGLTIARRAPDGLGSLLAAGLSLWIVMEALINMAVMVNLLPFAGNALPFISYGGSNLFVSLCAVGILLNISRLSTKTKEDEGRFFGEVIDLRWRNRRRRVPGTRRVGSFKPKA